MRRLQQQRDRTDPLGVARTASEHPGRVALREDTREVTYAELDRLVDRHAATLPAGPGIEVVVPTRTVEGVVSLLGAWRAGRVPLPLPADNPGARERILDTWPPSTTYDVHPELALLLTTSGTTGAAKLVRLSHDNVTSNAAAIVEYLGITADDAALTTLPLHYTYGLSVLTSHLLAGATLVLTEESVSSATLWETAQRAGVTSFAGVPHTFELIDAAGLVGQLPATLRTATVAGGRMAPDDVRRWAGLLPALVVMYGQTEATARMAWLPPDLAHDRPDSIGLPIPGGSLTVEPVPGLDLPDGAGELVYDGPNVMLGYATRPADLARGRDVVSLRTGDLGVQDDDGLFRVVGRLARFAKVLGLRVDLDEVERRLADAGVTARALEHDGTVVVFAASGSTAARVRVLGGLGLPAHLVRVVPVGTLPVTERGKSDDAALRALLDAPEDGVPRPADLAERIRTTYAELLGRPDATVEQSFVDLGGDSLSYVEAAVRLGRLLPDVPPGWATMPVTALAAPLAPSPAPTSRVRGQWRTWPQVDVSLVLRAVAIVLVVGSHTDLWMVPGGAHTLLALVGLSLVRFHLPAVARGERVRRIGRTLRAIAVPALLVTGANAALRGTYDWATVAWLNNLLGSDSWTEQWRMWFVEALVWGLVGTAALLALPPVARWERRSPYSLPLVLVALTLVVRWSWIGWTADNPERYSLPFVWTFLALGWLVGRSVSARQRLVTAGLVLVATVGFFGDPVREGVVAGSLLLLLAVRQVRLPGPLLSAVGVLAASSLWVYLLHWEVYPPVEEVSEPLAFVVSFAVGIAGWWSWTRCGRALGARRARS